MHQCKALTPPTCLGQCLHRLSGLPDSFDPSTLAISLVTVLSPPGASIMWNSTGTACLIMATSETDATNQSYYGESKLHYLPAEASRADSACSVTMPKDGPVHDVQWSPDGEYFVVVAGFMPAKVGWAVIDGVICAMLYR